MSVEFWFGVSAGMGIAVLVIGSAVLIGTRPRRERRTQSAPPPDTIEYRNARSVAEWMRRAHEQRAGRTIREVDQCRP